MHVSLLEGEIQFVGVKRMPMSLPAGPIRLKPLTQQIQLSFYIFEVNIFCDFDFSFIDSWEVQQTVSLPIIVRPTDYSSSRLAIWKN